MDFQGVSIEWLGHDGFRFEKEGVVIIIDPFRLEKERPADYVLVTHEHFDHCSIDDLRKVVGGETVLICPHECLSAVSRLDPSDVVPLAVGERCERDAITVEAVAAYNTNKYRNQEAVYHPGEDGKLGYVVTLGGVRIYHAGDTDVIPEMQSVECDVALLPVSGTYVMTPEEAAEAAAMLKPQLAIPMHYGTIVGTEADAERFRALAGAAVRILKAS